MDVAEIEKRIDRVITGSIPVSTPLGGVDPANYNQVMEYAKTMATARHSIPEWLRGNVGDCLMICGLAMRWGMDPYFVAQKTYLMEGKSGTHIGYESQLIHAVIEAQAPLKGRLRWRFEGEGDDTICIVYGTFKGENEPHEYPSVPLGKRIKDIGRNASGNFRGSPLWLQKPRLQLFYDASRDWARQNCPDVLAGVYTHDELDDMEPVDVTPPGGRIAEMAQRLRDAKAGRTDRGFDVEHINREASARTIIEGEVNTDDAEQKKGTKDEQSVNEPDTDAGRQHDVDSVRDGGRDQGAGNEDVGATREDGREPVGQEGADAQADEAGEGDKPKGKAKRK